MQVFKFLWAPAALLLAINCNAQLLPKLTEDYEPLERPTLEEYNILRNTVFNAELKAALGARIKLTEVELLANDIIMIEKDKAYQQGLGNPELFTPSQNFFKVLEKIEQSTLYKYIAKMPKGGVLHARDTALCSTDCVISLTYHEHLWICASRADYSAAKFLFSITEPFPKDEIYCIWQLMSKFRDVRGNATVDKMLREQLTLYSVKNIASAKQISENLEKLSILVSGLLSYAPVWQEYYYKALEEFQADGVQYVEFRSTLPALYELNRTYTAVETIRIYKETLDRFMKENRDFIGSKVIYGPQRHFGKCTFAKYIKKCSEIAEQYPDFVAGFDLGGQVELDLPLKNFVPQLLNMSTQINFFSHGVETNWFGTSVDENVIDVVKLRCKRIGHGFSLLKHPSVLREAEINSIVLTVNPISDQVLMLESDLRNHPLTYFYAKGFRVVISSGDRSFWKAKPLSHDFHMAFLIASAHSDLRLLKQLAFNSINFSSLNFTQRGDALEKWQRKWNDYIVNEFQAIQQNNV